MYGRQIPKSNGKNLANLPRYSTTEATIIINHIQYDEINRIPIARHRIVVERRPDSIGRCRRRRPPAVARPDAADPYRRVDAHNHRRRGCERERGRRRQRYDQRHDHHRVPRESLGPEPRARTDDPPHQRAVEEVRVPRRR